MVSFLEHFWSIIMFPIDISDRRLLMHCKHIYELNVELIQLIAMQWLAFEFGQNRHFDVGEFLLCRIFQQILIKKTHDHSLLSLIIAFQRMKSCFWRIFLFFSPPEFAKKLTKIQVEGVIRFKFQHSRIDQPYLVQFYYFIIVFFYCFVVFVIVFSVRLLF